MNIGLLDLVAIGVTTSLFSFIGYLIGYHIANYFLMKRLQKKLEDSKVQLRNMLGDMRELVGNISEEEQEEVRH